MFQDSEIDAITTGDPFGCPPHGKYEKLISLAKQVPPATTVVVYPCDETSLRGASAAADLGIIVPILVGPVAKLTAVAKQHGIDIARYELVDGPHSEVASASSSRCLRWMGPRSSRARSKARSMGSARGRGCEQGSRQPNRPPRFDNRTTQTSPDIPQQAPLASPG